MDAYDWCLSCEKYLVRTVIPSQRRRPLTLTLPPLFPSRSKEMKAHTAQMLAGPVPKLLPSTHQAHQ